MTGTIFDIQKFSLHDGPGIRTTVFLKGCSLRCFWCQNPEGLNREVELQFTTAYCVGCGMCFHVCPEHAHVMVGGKHTIDRERCTLCGRCVEDCQGQALLLTGREMSVDEVVETVMEDEIYYRMSGGGVTLSGGDPLLQSEFSAALLAECRKRGAHTAIETALNGPWKELQRILEHTDLVMLDIKVMDPEKHKKATGVDNRRILENITKLSKRELPLIVRVPVVPTVNDTEEDIKAIAVLAATLPRLLYLELIPFHRLGEGKYDSLGMPIATMDLPQIGDDRIRQLGELAAECGIRVKGVSHVHEDSRKERKAV
jgi:pyruvate formate lyase activating enzyme